MEDTAGNAEGSAQQSFHDRGKVVRVTFTPEIVYTTKQEKFEGPLDLLLELIQKQKLSINEISLAKVTDEFVGYLKELQKEGQALLGGGRADQEILAEFLVIASQLLLIKSRSLLPQFAASPEEEESIAELESRLAEYQRVKEIAAELAKLAKGGPKSFSREAYSGHAVIFHPPKKFSVSMLAKAFAAVIEAVPKVAKLAEEKIKRIVSLEEKIMELQAFLKARVERAFSELVSGAKEKMEVIVSFLALLELAKQRLVAIEQKKLFDDIKIRKL